MSNLPRPERDISGESCLDPRAKPGESCFSNSRRHVVILLRIPLLVTVPEGWDADLINFWINGSSSCFDNKIEALDEQRQRVDVNGGCHCGIGKGRYLREATPADVERLGGGA